MLCHENMYFRHHVLNRMLIEPKVSVIVPVYNREKYLRQCVDSIRAQTLEDIEIILVDDGSTDNSSIICDEYAEQDARVRVVHKKNAGMGAAYNTGMSVARGRYISFIESDDFIDKTFLYDLYAHSNDGQYDIVKSLFKTLEETGITKKHRYIPMAQIGIALGRYQCSGLIQGHVSHWSAIYRREYLTKNEITFNETPGAHSQDFGFAILNFAFAEKVFVVDKTSITYRMSSGNHQPEDLNNNILDECELTIKRLLGSNLSINFWDIISRRIIPRLNVCYTETADKEQKQRIRRLLESMNKKRATKSGADMEEGERDEILRSKIFFGLFEIRDSISKREYLFMRIPCLSRIRTDKKSETRIFGISIYKQRVNELTNTIFLFGIPIIRERSNALPKFSESIKSKCVVGKGNSRQKSSINEYCYGKEEEINARLEDLKEFLYDAQYLALKVYAQHSRVLPPYKDIYQGKSIVICGSGPTLNFYRQIPNAVHIGLNRSFECDCLKLDYIFSWDFGNMRKDDPSYWEKLKSYRAKKVVGLFLNDDAPHLSQTRMKELDALALYSSARHGILHNRWEMKIHRDIEVYPLMDFCSVAFGAFHFALYTNPCKIFLVGIDNSLDGYFTSAHQQRFLEVDLIKNGWLKVKRFISIHYPDTEVISINPVGLKGIFKDVYTKEYVEKHPEISSPEILEY